MATGQLASLTDAESQTTSYTYDDAGGKLTEQYPDHTGGNPGDSTYGIVTFTNDAAGRVQRKQDQQGDTVTFNYDLAGRLTSRDYRTKVNSPSGTIADTDSFTYDKAGRMLTAVSGRYTNTVGYGAEKPFPAERANCRSCLPSRTSPLLGGTPDWSGIATAACAPSVPATGQSHVTGGKTLMLHRLLCPRSPAQRFR